MAIKKTDKGWVVDIQPGGRKGRRIQRTFLEKATAVAFERRAYVEAERMVTGAGAALSVSQLIDLFKTRYASVRFRGFKYEKYRLDQIKSYFLANDKSIGSVKLSDGEQYISYRKARGIKLTTISRDLNSLKRVFTWAVENDYLLYSPLAKLKGFKSEVRIRWLTEAECKSLLDTAKQYDPPLWLTIFVALNTGFRLSNIMELVATDIHEGFITARRTKSGKPYDAPIASSLVPFIDALKAKEGRLLDTQNIDRRFRRLVKSAGLYTNEDDPLKVTFHTLRHTFAAYWLQKGTPIYTVSKWMGHSSVAVTEKIYGHLSTTHHLAEIKKAPGIS